MVVVEEGPSSEHRIGMTAGSIQACRTRTARGRARRAGTVGHFAWVVAWGEPAYDLPNEEEAFPAAVGVVDAEGAVAGQAKLSWPTCKVGRTGVEVHSVVADTSSRDCLEWLDRSAERVAEDNDKGDSSTESCRAAR